MPRIMTPCEDAPTLATDRDIHMYQSQRWPLPLRARLLSPAAACTAVTLIVATAFPEAEIYLGGGDNSPRVLGPIEYGPMLIALSLCLGMSPRLPDWDRYGARCTRINSLAILAATLIVPLVVFLGLLMAPLRVFSIYDVEPVELMPYGSNIAVSGALVFGLVGTLGRVAGTVFWAATMLCLIFWQSSAPSYGHLLPLTGHFSYYGGVDDGVRWVWICLLVGAAAWIAWVRRAVPLSLTVRSAED